MLRQSTNKPFGVLEVDLVYTWNWENILMTILIVVFFCFL
jgi:hypothetical protein